MANENILQEIGLIKTANQGFVRGNRENSFAHLFLLQFVFLDLQLKLETSQPLLQLFKHKKRISTSDIREFRHICTANKEDLNAYDTQQVLTIFEFIVGTQFVNI